jgi:hypothetical protein
MVQHNSPDPEARNVQLAKEFISGGAEISGAAAGAAIGLLGGPVGVVAGAAAGVIIGRTLAKVGAEIQRRVLGPREHLRMGAVAGFAGSVIKAQLDAGRRPRDDGFFDADATGRSKADELLEGVLTKARDAYEEKKLPYLGTLYAQLAFHPKVSARYGNFLIKLAGELTYSQYVALAIGNSNPQPTRLRATAFRNDGAALATLDNEATGLLLEIYDLYQRGIANGGDGSVWLSVPDVTPGTFKIQAAGVLLVALMGLEAIPEVDKRIFYSRFPPVS